MKAAIERNAAAIRTQHRLFMVVLAIVVAMSILSIMDRRRLHAENDLSKVQRAQNRADIAALKAEIRELRKPR